MGIAYAQYVNGQLRPYSQPVAEEWAKMSQFEVVQVKVVRNRSKLHGLYHALLGYVRKALEASGEDWTHDDIHKEIKQALGYYKIKKLPKKDAKRLGQKYALEYLSTSFDSMSEDQFREFAFKAFGVIEENICPNLMESDYSLQVDKIIARFRA